MVSPVILNVLVSTLLLVASILYSSPGDYAPIDGTEVDYSSAKALDLLGNITRVVSGIQSITYLCFGYYFESHDQGSLIKYTSFATSWAIAAITSSQLSKAQNARSGGHHSLLFGFVLLAISHIEQVMEFCSRNTLNWGIEVSILSIELVIVLILIFTFGLWRVIGDEDPKMSGEKHASIFSKFSYHWMDPLIQLGNEKHLDQEDIWKLIECDQSEEAIKDFKSKRKPKWSLAMNIVYLSLPWVIYQYLMSSISSILAFAGPYFLFQIISKLQEPNVDRMAVSKPLFALFAFAVTKSLVDGQTYFAGRRAGLRARAVLIELLYNKSLQRVQGLNPDEEEQASFGTIVTLMSVDTERIRLFLSYSHDIAYRIPISLTIAIAGLVMVLGWPALIGIAVTVIMGGISTWLGKQILKLQQKLLKSTDSRVSIMNEMIQGIRIIKYFAWEQFFIEKVEKARKSELSSLIKLWGGQIGFSTIGSSSGVVIAVSTFAVYTLVAGKSLDTATAFTAINLLRVVSQLMSNLPNHTMILFNAITSFKRISGFLKEQNIERYTEGYIPSPKSEAIELKNASFCYYGNESNPDCEYFKLKNMTTTFPKSRLTLITGATGSGKSSVLLSLLGELKQTGGTTLNSFKSVAFVAQTAWLRNATIRENILFGEEFDKDRYLKVIEACALAKDLINIEGGDLAEIGEKGINMSGGQKQRISLARACYSRASHVLLDDPLSAVDAPTARYLVHKCILGLLKGRTVILVSHATNLIFPFAAHVVLLKNGEIAAQGTPNEILNSTAAEQFGDIDMEQDVFEDDHKEVAPILSLEGTKLIKDEEKATGAVGTGVYFKYCTAIGGLPFIAVFILSFGFTWGAKFSNDWWLKQWTDVSSTLSMEEIFSMNHMGMNLSKNPFQNSITNLAEKDPIYYVTIYACFGLGIILAANLQTIIVLVGSLWASKKLHNSMLNAIIQSPLRFFECTPVGRILNRFSKDIENVDSQVATSMKTFVDKLIQTITIMAIIGAIAPVFLIGVPFIMYTYWCFAIPYLNVSRELKRFESTTKSPIYAQFSETLAGVCTIRAYANESRFIQMNRKKVDQNHMPYFFVWAANRWLCVRSDIISASVVLCAGLSVVLSGVEAGWAAITITYSLEFTEALLWLVRTHADMEMSMNSVERILEYTTIDQEAPAIIENHRPAEDWPQHGAIQVKDLSMRYAPELPDVLQRVSFEVFPHEKVAVVGRTGAGKSTLSLAFFRIIPLSNGSITIDGEDISQLGLYDLRSKLTMIPQDPVLFTGTLRSDLDPLQQSNDHTIFQALQRVHFLDSIQPPTHQPSTQTLDIPVTENGSNFSQGQRQLLCLARSLLQGNKIIFLDEATASVDIETDAKIQNTIRTEFADRTIICIAHRLRTIIDFDKVLVLDKGRVLEFGSPLELIERKGGMFRSMCEETGEYELLCDIAKQSNDLKILQQID